MRTRLILLLVTLYALLAWGCSTSAPGPAAALVTPPLPADWDAYVLMERARIRAMPSGEAKLAAAKAFAAEEVRVREEGKR